MSRLFTTIRSALWSVAFIALWVWVAIQVRPLDARLPVAIPAGVAPLGWLLAVPGGALALASILWFTIRGRGTPAPFDAPREFVASGPYRLVRNPMYAGAALVIAGGGLITRSIAIVLLAPAFLLLMHGFAVIYEEPTLRERFGKSYRDYCAHVGRWWPRALPWRTSDFASRPDSK